MLKADEYIEIEEIKSNIAMRDGQVEACTVIEEGNDTLIIFPTSYGKTKPAIYAVMRAISLGKKVIWLAPLKALVDEQVETLSRYCKVLKVTGDSRDNKKYIKTTDADVIIMTYEMLGIILSNKSVREGFIDKIGAVIIDEAHNICEEERGAKLEASYKILKSFYPDIQTILLSATVKNHQQFAQYLNAKLVYRSTEHRPVPLVKEIRTFWKARNAQANYEAKLEMVRQIFVEHAEDSPKPQMLVFCSSRERCSRLHEALNGYQGFSTAYHTAGLKSDARHEVEQKFENKDIYVIFCTPTLAQGRNLPADIVILFDVTRWNWLRSGDEFLSRNEIIQTIGRAGRFGMSRFGLAIALCGEDEERTVDDYWNNPLEVDSSILENIDFALLYWIVSGVEDQEKLLQAYKTIFTNAENLTSEIYTQSIDYLLTKKFIYNDKESYRPTVFGSLTIWMGIRPQTAVHFRAMVYRLNNEDDISLEDLYAQILNTDEFTENIVVRTTRSDNIAILNGQRFLEEGTDDRIAKAFTMTFNDYLADFHGLEKVPATDGDLYVLQDASKRIISACETIMGKVFKHKKRLNELNKCVEHGILDKNIIGLYESLSFDDIKKGGIGVSRAIKLYKDGIKTADDFVKTDNTVLKKIIERISDDMLDKIKLKIMEKHDYENPEAYVQPKMIKSKKPTIIKPKKTTTGQKSLFDF